MAKKAAEVTDAGGSQDTVARAGFDDRTRALIRKAVAAGVPDTDFEVFLHTCERSGLDPLARQIYLREGRSRGKSTWTAQTGIDGYRLIADRTGKYAGNDDPVFDDDAAPRKATVTVYKLVGGVRCPFTASARWDQYFPGESQGFMWHRMPHLMLGKCAEALALRKAFPAELSSIYVREEMDQAAAADDAAPDDEAQRTRTHAPRQTPVQAAVTAVEQAPPPVHQGEARKAGAKAPFSKDHPGHREWLRKMLAKKDPSLSDKDRDEIAAKLDGFPFEAIGDAWTEWLGESDVRRGEVQEIMAAGDLGKPQGATAP